MSLFTLFFDCVLVHSSSFADCFSTELGHLFNSCFFFVGLCTVVSERYHVVYAFLSFWKAIKPSGDRGARRVALLFLVSSFLSTQATPNLNLARYVHAKVPIEQMVCSFPAQSTLGGCIARRFALPSS